ncbi:MAG: hypothetical protein ACLVA2_02985 [Clostridia bacterium]
MENASKALIMAGSVLIALIVIGAFILMLNNLNDYQEKNDTIVQQQQIVEFNNQFSTYDRTGLRGTDMLSLMNRIIDYNSRKTTEDIGFQKMKITIKGLDSNILQSLRYETSGNNLLIKKNTYTQDNLSEIVTKPQELERKYQKKYITQLVSNISKFMDIYNSSLSINQKIQEINEKKWLPKSVTTYGSLDSVKNDILIYYEYSQFKRTYFDSTGETKYDKNTGRITELNFNCVGIGE